MCNRATLHLTISQIWCYVYAVKRSTCVRETGVDQCVVITRRSTLRNVYTYIYTCSAYIKIRSHVWKTQRLHVVKHDVRAINEVTELYIGAQSNGCSATCDSIELNWILLSKYTCVDMKVRHITCTKIIEHLGSEALTGILVQTYI